MIEHWRLADTSARALAGAGSPLFASVDGSPQGRDPRGARSERSGDDSAVPAFMGRGTPPQPCQTCFWRVGTFRPSGASHDHLLLWVIAI